MNTAAQTLSKLRAKKDLMVRPSHTEFFEEASKGMRLSLSDAEFDVAYKLADKKYNEAYAKYREEMEAIDYAINHYEGQIKLELALSLID